MWLSCTIGVNDFLKSEHPHVMNQGNATTSVITQSATFVRQSSSAWSIADFQWHIYFAKWSASYGFSHYFAGDFVIVFSLIWKIIVLKYPKGLDPSFWSIAGQIRNRQDDQSCSCFQFDLPGIRQNTTGYTKANEHKTLYTTAQIVCSPPMKAVTKCNQNEAQDVPVTTGR